MQPIQPVQPVVGDHRSWPAGPAKPHVPFDVPLHPSELLSRTFDLWRDDAFRLTSLTALPYAFVTVVAVAVAVGAVAIESVSRQVDMSTPAMAALVGLGGGLCLTAALMFLAASAGTFLIVEEKLRRESNASGAMGALLSGMPHLLRLGVAYLMVCLTVGAPLLPAIIGTVAAVSVQTVTFAMSAIGLWVVGGVLATFLAVRLAAVGPALVLEQVGPFRAFARSIELTRGNFRDAFLACFCFFSVLGFINMATTVVGMIPLLGAIVQLVVGVVLASLQSVFVALLYAALRDREAAR
jgi:hypothetical protein